MPEPFSIKKFFDFSPLAMSKSVGIGIKLVAILIVVYTVYRAWFAPKQTQQIVVKKGGVATIIQKTERRRTLIPFIEGFVEQSRNDKMNTGIRAGLRIEL